MYTNIPNKIFNSKLKKLFLYLLMLIALEECLTFIVVYCFFELSPIQIFPKFILSFFFLIVISWRLKYFKKKDFFKPTHIILIATLLFLSVHFRSGILWAFNTFPLMDASAVLLTLQKPFDDFAFSMIKQYLASTIPLSLIIAAILIIFLYTIFNTIRKRLLFIALYFLSTIILLFHDLSISDYIHILNDEPEKTSAYSHFFSENYVNPDSVIITPPQNKRNLILIYLESMETTYSDKRKGGNQEVNLIPEITNLAKENISFGKRNGNIGGGLDAMGSNHTFGSMYTRTLGIPYTIDDAKVPIMSHYNSLYKILNKNGYKQFFFQGNPGLYEDFKKFVEKQKIDEIYGPEEIINVLKLNVSDLIKKQGYKTIQDKDAFKFATKLLDSIPEPFSLTFFTIDSHAPNGLYDPDCIKVYDENNKDELLKSCIRCASKELYTFISSIQKSSFYKNTSIIIFGDHLFMGTRLVKDFPNRKWIDIFINAPKISAINENRTFSDIDMFPTILSSLNFKINGDKLGFGVNLFSDKKTLIEQIGLDSLNKEIKKFPSHLVYESYLLQKKSNNASSP